MTPAILDFKQEVPTWSIENYGGKVIIDDYSQMPTGTIASIDIETDEKDNIVCIGICEDGVTVKVFFDIQPSLITYLQQVQIVGHGCKGAEIPWLSKYGVIIDQLYFDTMIGTYVYDSSRKGYGLKKTLEDLFGTKYPTYDQVTTDPTAIEIACQSGVAGILPTDKKGKPKLPKKLTLDKFHKDYVAQYNAADCFYTFKLYTWLRQNMSVAQTNFYNNIELPMTKLIHQMEKQGVKIDTKSVRRIHNETSKARRTAAKQIFEITGTKFNLNSPKQLLPILQNNGIGVTSTGEEAVQPFRHIPLVQALLDYRRCQKVCSTYTTPLYFNSISSSNNRIHARFNQNTITGRLSSSDPINLQNQPPIVKECFVAADNYKLIGSDWSNIELRLPAHLSGEPKFVNEFNRDGGDLHTTTAKFLFGDNVQSLPEKEFKEKRAKAKTCNFLLTNSGTANRLRSELSCTDEEAEILYKKFWEGYPVLAAWLKEEKRKARLAGGVTSMYGRWVPIPGLKSWCGAPNCPIYDRSRKYYCKPCAFRETSEREAISILVQGSASDLMKLSALRIYKEYSLVPVVSCHDELLYEVKEELAQNYFNKIKFSMENVVSLKVPLKTDIKIGNSWKEAH